MRDPGEALVDMLLREMVGGELPPKLTAGIQAKLARRRRLVWFRRIGMTAAAVLMVAAGLFVSFRKTPAVDTRTAQHVNPARNSVITAEEKPVTVALGEYCFIETAPETVIRITGEEKKEQVFLEKGEVTCEVEPGQGEFAVETPVGMVAVKGTAFTVRLLADEDIPGQETPFKRMSVKVSKGTVEVSGAWGADLVRAGQQVTVPRRPEPEKAEPEERPVVKPETPRPGPKPVEFGHKPGPEKKERSEKEKTQPGPQRHEKKHGHELKADEGRREQVQEKREQKIQAHEKKQEQKHKAMHPEGIKKPSMDIPERIKRFGAMNRRSPAESKKRMLMLLRLKNGKGSEFAEAKKMVSEYAEEKGISEEQARKELIEMIGKFKTPDGSAPKGPGTGPKGPGIGPKGPGKGPAGPGGTNRPGKRARP